MTIQARPGRLAMTLTWLHALLYVTIAAACYVAPEVPFGDAAWLPLARLAVLMLAAVLVALAVVLIGATLSANTRQVRTALFAALVIDVQVPVLLLAHPASVEYWHRDLGIRWLMIPNVFLILIGVCAYTVLALGRRPKVEAVAG
jgi:hypothetical protein